MKLALSVMILCVSFLSVSCSYQPNNAQSGAVIGAAGGALVGQAIGKDTQSTLIGTAVGTFLGYMFGNEMDKYDRSQMNNVYERGMSGQTSSWVNPDSGNQYYVTPNQATSGNGSEPCRTAAIEAIIDGQRQTTYSTACRDYNGNWKLQ